MGEEVAANGKAQGQAWDGAQFRNITNHGSQHRKGFSGMLRVLPILMHLLFIRDYQKRPFSICLGGVCKVGRHQERGHVCVHRGTGNAGRGDSLLPPLQEELWELIG